MNRPTKADVIEYFGTEAAAGEFMGLTRQGVEAWPYGELNEKRYRLLLGSFTRQGRRLPRDFRAEPLRNTGAA